MISIGILQITLIIVSFVGKIFRLQGTGQNYGLVSSNRPVSTGFYKGTLVSFLGFGCEKVLYLEV